MVGARLTINRFGYVIHTLKKGTEMTKQDTILYIILGFIFIILGFIIELNFQQTCSKSGGEIVTYFVYSSCTYQSK